MRAIKVLAVIATVIAALSLFAMFGSFALSIWTELHAEFAQTGLLFIFSTIAFGSAAAGLWTVVAE